MIRKETYQFLKDLQKNNFKEWFHENKTTYNSCRHHFIHVIEILIHEIRRFDKSITGIQPKDCIFRINRDIRFSKDKSPYKTNFGAFISPGGRNTGKAGYYIHVEPGASFLAGGIYMPPAPILKAIRQEILENYEEFLGIVKAECFVKYFGAIKAEKLKTAPRGFPKEFDGIEYLKFKHYTVMDAKTDTAFMSTDFPATVIEEFKALQPLISFINHVEV